MKNSVRVLTIILIVVLVETGLLHINRAEWKLTESEPNTNHLDVRARSQLH
jgi:hypothetical protein